jgi:hemolysin activation/secretion protein
MKKSHYLTGLLSMSVLTAAPFTDTGSIYKQIKQSQTEKAQQNVHPTQKKEIIKQKKLSGKQIVSIKGFKILGNDEFSEAEINQILAPFIGKTLLTEELSKVTNALTEYYHKKGFFDANVALTSPYILEDGLIVLIVDEKHLEKDGISVENSGKRIKTKKVLDLWNNTLKPGAIKQNSYERAMLLTNDFPGISATADLYYGTDDNTDDMVITVTDGDGFNGNIDIDNYGSYYTGRTEIGTTLYWNSPTKNGEEIVARFISTGKYSNYGYLDLAVPVFNNGMKLGASADFLKYELDTSKSTTEGDGTAWNARAYIKYPIVRTEDFTLEAELNYTHTEMKDNNDSAQLDNTVINKGIFTISGNKSDTFLDNGITYFSASVTLGDLNLKDKAFKATDNLLYQTLGSFTKVNFSLSRLQNIVGAFSSKISIDGQWANKNLDSSEKYFLGGPYSLGGYPVGTVSGDNAAVFYADLRYDFYNMPWGGDFQLSTYYTYGWTQIFKDTNALLQTYPDFAQYSKDNEVKLQSVGIGLSQTWSSTTVLRVMVGKQVGDNVLRQYFDPKDKDYDHSDSDYRAWVNLIYYF